MIFLINLLFAAELDARSLDGIDPVLVNELMTLQPVTTRAGYPRFVDGALDHDQATQVLAVRLHAAEDEVPVRAALAAHLAYSADVDLLLDLLEAEQDPDVALHLLPGLKDAPADVALPALRDALRHDAPGMRAEAARVLSLRKDGGDASAALIAALEDEAPEVRAFAARALGYHHVAEAFVPVQALLTDEDDKVRLQAVRALGRIDAQRAATVVAPLTNDPDPHVARKAASLASGL